MPHTLIIAVSKPLFKNLLTVDVILKLQLFLLNELTVSKFVVHELLFQFIFDLSPNHKTHS